MLFAGVRQFVDSVQHLRILRNILRAFKMIARENTCFYTG